MSWKIKQIKSIKLKEAIMVEGLPGLGNVGKIAVDYIIDSTKASKIYEISHNHPPNYVFINEENQIEEPKINIYHKKINRKDILLLSGDIHPENSTHEFCNKVFEVFKKKKGKELVILGGIGTVSIPKEPKVFCTGTNQKIIEKYSPDIKANMFGMVGPIFGVSAQLLSIAKKKKVPSAALLAETFAHPTHIGIKEARELINVLNKKLNLNINIKEIDKEIREIQNLNKSRKLNNIIKKLKPQDKIEYADYIG